MKVSKDSSNAVKHHQTAAEDKVAFKKKVFYGCGSFAEMTWQWALINLALPVFNVGLGYSPVIIGAALSITRIWDGITDPVMGSISDNSRSRFGRRRPFIALGAILSGLLFSCIFLIPEGIGDWKFAIYFTAILILFYTAFTIFSVPFYALGYELSPDYHEKTKIMGVRIFANSINGVLLAPWIFYMMQRPFWDSTSEGIRYVGVGLGLLTILFGLIPALTIKEPIKKFIEKQERTPILKSVKYVISNKSFLFLILAFFCALIANTSVSTMYLYPIAYKVFDGNLDVASGWYGWASASHHIATLIMIVPITIISQKIGKRKTTILFTSLIILGSIMQLFCYTPKTPWLIILPRIILGSGFAGFWVLIPAMIADVIDLDEWNNGSRREGMFAAVHSWVIKVAFALGLMASGFVLNYTGFDIDLGTNQAAGTMESIVQLIAFVPVIGALMAIYFISRYTLTEEKSYEIRASLEQRRGKH